MPELTLVDFGKRLLMVKNSGAVVHPLFLGLLLTAFLGPFGWIVLFIVAMKDGKRARERPTSNEAISDEAPSIKSAPQ
jgi:hypothetical protein